MKSLFKPFLFALLAALAGAGLPSPAAALRVTDVLPYTVGDMAVNARTNRLYLSTKDGVQVLDAKTHFLFATIPAHPYVDIEVDEAHNRLYLTDLLERPDPTITLVDGETNQVVRSALFAFPDVKRDRGYNPTSNRFYAVDIGCSNIDCKSFVAVYDGDTLEQVDWITLPHVSTKTLAIDPERNRAYVGIQSYGQPAYLYVIDLSNNAIVRQIPMPSGSAQLAFDPSAHTLYSLDSQGLYVTVVDTLREEVVARYRQPYIPNGRGTLLRSMSLNPSTGEILFYQVSGYSTYNNIQQQTLWLWGGAVDAPNQDLRFTDSMELADPIYSFTYSNPYNRLGLWHNPVTGRYYANYGSDSERRSVLVIGHEPAPPASGDVNGDGRLNVTDVVEILKIIAHHTPTTTSQRAVADQDANGLLDIRDAVLLLRKIVVPPAG
ncbi:MAG: hypothetical protein KY468_03805 [Armatimonadetes bacterium]|nr:hypothetical protein [Armatimonadota bacterium]